MYFTGLKSITCATSPFLLLGYMVALAAAGGCSEEPTNPDLSLEGDTLLLRPESELTTGCGGWPEEDFTPANKVQARTQISTDQRAIEFTLKDLDGNSHSLSSLLETKPVLMVFGSYT